MKIFVAIPLYDGKLGIETVRSLLSEQAVALGVGDEFFVSFLSGDAGIAGARNCLAQEFMDSGFDRLVFLDSDISFEPGALVKLAHQPVDFVGGCYRYKHPDEAYPISWLPKRHLQWDENKLLDVRSLPTGFMALSRKVFESFQEKFPDRRYTHLGIEYFCYFQIKWENGHLCGEDFLFCEEWTAMGGHVYLDPEINLTHWAFSPTPYQGHIGQWLKGRPKAEEAV